jgi:hypothetical protein
LDKVHLIRRDGEIAVDLAGGYSRFEGLPVLSGDQVVVGRRSGFNFVRDIVVPVASLTGAVAAIIYASRR